MSLSYIVVMKLCCHTVWSCMWIIMWILLLLYNAAMAFKLCGRILNWPISKSVRPYLGQSSVHEDLRGMFNLSKESRMKTGKKGEALWWAVSLPPACVISEATLCRIIKSFLFVWEFRNSSSKLTTELEPALAATTVEGTWTLSVLSSFIFRFGNVCSSMKRFLKMQLVIISLLLLNSILYSALAPLPLLVCSQSFNLAPSPPLAFICNGHPISRCRKFQHCNNSAWQV